MNAIFSGLLGQERRTLERLTAVVLFVLVLGFVLATRQRSSYFEARDSLAALQNRYRRVQKSRTDAKTEWSRWQEAVRDMDSFKGTFFYDEKTLFGTLRMDLQRIFNEAGMNVPLISYHYSDLEKVPIKKIALTFNYSGTYDGLKRFLTIVEKFKKFLAVEKIDFEKADAESGLLSLKMTLAGYYEI
jgi:Tfp pilus assembly protein PilO